MSSSRDIADIEFVVDGGWGWMVGGSGDGGGGVQSHMHFKPNVG